MGFWHTVVDDWLGIDLPPEKKPADNSAAIQQSLDAQTAALQEQTKVATQAATDSLAAQRAALLQSEAALRPAIDSESNVVAQESRQRKLQQTSPFGIGLQKKLGAAPTGFRVLSGQ